jgi:hypothetical protein
MTNITRHDAEGAIERGPSPAIWKDLGKWQSDMNRGACIVQHQDFISMPAFATTVAQQGIYPFAIGGTTVAGDSTAVNTTKELGVLLFSNTTAGSEAGIMLGGPNGSFRVNPNDGAKGKVCFECGFKLNTITANNCYVFTGLSNGTVATNDLVDDTGAAKAAKDFIGFHRLATSVAGMDTMFQATSQTKVVVGANAATLAADTYTKLGFMYDPTQIDSNKKIRFFQDGVELAGAVNSTQLANTTTFPDNGLMTPQFVWKAGAGAGLPRIDFMTCGMYMQSRE